MVAHGEDLWGGVVRLRWKGMEKLWRRPPRAVVGGVVLLQGSKSHGRQRLRGTAAKRQQEMG